MLGLGLIVTVFNITLLAQQKRVELSAAAGYSLATGFDVGARSLGGITVATVGMNSGFSYNFEGDYLIGPNFGIGFLFSRQESELTARGFTPARAPKTVTIAEMPTYHYQFPLTYNFFERDATIRPFVFGGIGWTQFSPGNSRVNVPGGNTSVDLDNKSRFAGTFGGGVKFFVTPAFGVKVSGRWTPTAVNSKTEGIWCNAYYCASSVDYKFSNQGEFSGGLFVRF
jgi:opacity protein-like surface antigen